MRGTSDVSAFGNGRAPTQDAFRDLYDRAESQAARAFDQAVNTASFGRLLATVGENAAALSRIRSDVADLVIRNLRLVGKADIVRLARQLHATEDALERVLQEVEQLRDQIAAPRGP
jgi:hypothetical protein